MSIEAERILFWKSNEALQVFGEHECMKALFYWAGCAISRRYYG